MRIVCLQTILMKYHTLFFSKTMKDDAKSVVWCSRDWRFKGENMDEIANCLYTHHHNLAVTCDFQQYGILTSVDSNEPVHPPFKFIKSKMLFGQ